MTARVWLFAAARDAAGAEEIAVPLLAGATVADLRRALLAWPGLAALLPRCAIAVNRQYASDTDPISPADEVAVLPPVSGG
jgi:molybdopterin converting factor subunit 1